MGRNKKETFIFTLMMCFLMVTGMSIYNVILANGFTASVFADTARGFLPAFAVALLLDVFVISKPAKALAHKFIRDTDPMAKRVILISLFMVSGMVLCMSLYGALVHIGFSEELPLAYLSFIGKNFICALPLQLIVVGPLSRFIFLRIYPVGRAVPSAANH
jgi:hypothetical protein